MPVKEFLSCSEAAELMGVSRSTVKRYCENGELRNHKTVGHHRRIDSRDVARWVSGQRNKKRKRSGIAKRIVQLKPEYIADCLLNGALKKLDVLVEQVVLGKTTIAKTVDSQLGPAMWDIGQRWQSESITYADERRATSNLKLLFRSFASSLQLDTDAPKAVGGSLEGDQAEIGSMAIELVAKNVGFDAYHVGSNLPAATLGQIATQMKAKLVWVSYCHIEDTEFMLGAHAELERLLAPDVVLGIGGYALNDKLLQNMIYDFYGTSCNQFDEFLRQQII